MSTSTASYSPLTPSHVPSPASQQRGGYLKRVLVPFLLLLPSLVLLGAALALSLFGLKFNDTDKNYGCDPVGHVWVGSKNRPNLWGKDYGLAITLGFGDFSFSEAKLIDIFWDLAIGRGSQVLAGVLIYYIFRGPVVQMMDRSAVPYDKVLKMEYHPSGLSAFLTYCKDVHWRRRSWWQWFTAFMMALSTAYILVMPTLVSAMTGYQPWDKPLLQTDPTTYVTFDDLEKCAYVIQDGGRIGLGNNACISKTSKAYPGITHYLSKYVPDDYPGTWTGYWDAANVSSTVYIPGWQPHHIQSPLLNITRNDLSTSNTIFYDGHTYTVAELAKQGTCAPQSAYRWGFSLILLFMFLSVTWVLSIPLYFVAVIHFWKTYKHPPVTSTVFGTLRTPLAVADSVRHELGGAQTDRLSEKEIVAMLQKRGSGLKMRRRASEIPSGHMLGDMHKQTRPYRSRTSTLTATSSYSSPRSHSESSFV